MVRSAANMKTPIANPFVDMLRAAVPAYCATNVLPSLSFDAAIDDFGLFSVVRFLVIDCAVAVVDRDASERLGPGAKEIQDGLRRLVGEVLGAGYSVVVRFDPQLVARQALMIAALPDWRASSSAVPLATLSGLILPHLRAAKPVGWADLTALADRAFGGTQAGGAYVAKDAYDAMETAFHALILEKSAAWAPGGSVDDAVRVAGELDSIASLLPTQTRRDQEMVEFQEFSTPANYAFALAWVAGIGPDEEVFEPSAGTGALAVHAKNAGAVVRVNEISPRRRAALVHLGFAPTQENGEQVHNILSMQPNVVLMNPPFSRSATRMGDRAVPGAAAEHVIAALKLLKDGGRLVAITGATLNAKGAGGSFLDRVRQLGTLRASVLVDGGVYRRNGTNVETRVLVIDKVKSADNVPLVGRVTTIEQLIRLLAPVRRQTAVTAQESGDPGDVRFCAYVPTINFPGARPHPGELVESAAMAAVPLPSCAYKPHFGASVLTEGRLSLAQLEPVVYAGQAHSTFLPANDSDASYRRGYLIGDGTGVGKGREVAGIIYDNLCAGRSRHLWISKDDTKLLRAARRDFTALGGARDTLFSLRDFAAGERVTRGDGVMFVSFGTLRSAKPGKRRIDQILQWVGDPETFDGVIAIDEAHKAGNALDIETDLDTKPASQTAVSVIEIQRLLPKARVVYVSATAASEVRNLCYADRLGLYGPGTPFATKECMVASIEAGGVAAMEIVARDLKSMGLLCARSLSYRGVQFERLIHELTPDQERLYDTMADAWRTVMERIDTVMEAAGSKKNSRARATALSQFWSSHQRFFNQVCISLMMPSLLDAIEADQKSGHASVIQLVSTMEAATSRALSAEGAMDNLEDLDITPREVLINYLMRAFPTAAYEEFSDPDGNAQTRPVRDAEGKLVLCREAVNARDELIAEIGSLSVPDGPLDMILDRFGPDAVAEVTGRSRRLVQRRNDRGEFARVIETRGEAGRLADMDAFADDKKRIIVYSNAANTGVDFHASRAIKNQRLRRHYIIDPGFNAKEITQGLGRTHRSDQAQPPVYILAGTNLKGAMRFVTSIARRLDQLGALTRGQRDTGSQGLFSDRDNLESPYGQSAIRQMVFALHHGDLIAGMDMEDFQAALGLRLTNREGDILETKIPTVRQFLNRVLALRIAVQNDVFDDFAERMEENIQAAIDAGVYNLGVERLIADRIEQIAEPRIVHVDPTFGATTSYVHLRAFNRRNPRSFDMVAAGWSGGRQRTVQRWVVDKLGKAHAACSARATTYSDGRVVPQVRLVGPFAESFVPADHLSNGDYRTVTESSARKAWDEQVENADQWDERELHLLVGTLLPVWDRIKGAGRVVRISTDEGASYLGRLIDRGAVRSTLAALGSGIDTPWTAEEAIDAVLDGRSLSLANGWLIKRARVSGEWRIELTGWRESDRRTLIAAGIKQEIITYKTRLFIPTGETKLMGALIAQHPIRDDGALAA